jgi:hypothetical protein
VKRLTLSERLFLELYDGRPYHGLHYREVPKPAQALAKRGLVRVVRCSSGHGDSVVVYLTDQDYQTAHLEVQL